MQQLLYTIAIWAVPVLFAITLHEAAHGWVASKLGDPTARQLGRITMNPIKHIDPIGTVIVPLLLVTLSGFIIGWAKPVPVDPRHFKQPLLDMALVALAGPVSNFIMAAFWAQEPSYSMLFSNISDREAGEIIDVLTASDIPHEMDHKSGAILVAGDRVHDARLKLAAQGLPRGSDFGLEIIQGETGFSTSQFMENARYHHAVETELSRTIGNLRPVQYARVHLALPKSSAFLTYSPPMART